MYAVLSETLVPKPPRATLWYAAGYAFRLARPVEGDVFLGDRRLRVRHEVGTRLTSRDVHARLDDRVSRAMTRLPFEDDDGNLVVFSFVELMTAGGDLVAFAAHTNRQRSIESSLRCML